MPPREPYVAIALLTQSELEGLGNTLRLVIPTDRLPDEFEELLAKIDEADEQLG